MKRRREPISRTSGVLAVLAALASCAALYLLAGRLRHGLDWTDEAFYVALPARFVMGDRPFVDELNVAENAGIFVWPFLKVWHAFFGWTGVFAFIRFLYVAFFLGVGATLYRLARACGLSLATGLLLAAACPFFIPYGLPGLSYNTLGAGFCALGLFTAARALVVERAEPSLHRDPFLHSGVLLGCAAFAYPTIVLAAIAACVAVFMLSTHRLRAFVKICAGGLLVGVLLAPLFLRAGLRNIHALMDYSFGGPAPSAGSFHDKLSVGFEQFQQLNPELWKGFAIVALAVLVAKRAPFVALFLPYLPFVVRGPPTDTNAIVDYFACFGTYAPLFALGLERRRIGAVLVLAIWVPAVTAAIAVTISSGNGARGAGIGMFPGTLVSALLFTLFLEERSRRWTFAFLRPLMQLAPLGFLYVLLQYATADTAVYRDEPFHLLTAQVTSGPYKGLYTTPKRKEWLAKVEADVLAYRAGKRTTFFYDFPAGYLFDDLPPHLPSSWNFNTLPYRTNIEARWLRERTLPGEYVFRFFGGGNSALDVALRERATSVATGESYTIWKVR